MLMALKVVSRGTREEFMETCPLKKMLDGGKFSSSRKGKTGGSQLVGIHECVSKRSK